MHPTAARSNRSSLQSSIPPTSTPSSLLHPQQQQILYGPIVNPMLTLQRCSTGLHPSCIYPGTQRNAALPSPLPLHIQGKSNRWLPKNKLVRSQQYCQQQQQQQQQQQPQQQHIQQQLSYNPKPLLLYDQPTNNSPLPAPTASFLVASSTYTHGSFSGDQYNNSGVTLIPQPYYKPPSLQSFCLVQDRQSTQQQQQQQQQQEQSSHGSYYNISATNSCNLQTVNTNSTFQFSNLSPYASTNFPSNQITEPIRTIQSTQIYPNSTVNVAFDGVQRDEPSSSASTLDVSSFKRAKSEILAVDDTQIASNASESYVWPSRTISSTFENSFDPKPDTDRANRDVEDSPEKVTSSVPARTQEEHYSDESSASFDFTIEAEKMVSALCNTSLNELGKEETKNDKSDSAPLFNGAGDAISNKNAWFADLCADYGTGVSVAVQTDDPSIDRTQYPELLRKVVYWGCTEAEIVLSGNSKQNPRAGWLKDLSAATKTAVMKSSTCFPIFGGDRAFVGDLISALLRIGNGWLVLDNYLNKQHYPSLEKKFDHELVRCFQLWEENTHELLSRLVRTFLKLEESNDGLEPKPESFGASFPGDVSVYANCDLFDPSSSVNANTSRQEAGSRKSSQEGSFGAARIANPAPEKQPSRREAKLRSKWTVTENLATVDSTKSAPDMFLGHAEVGVQASGRFRSRAASSSAKIDASARSLNAEFFHLRSKILTESNQESSKQWTFKEKKREFRESKLPTRDDSDSVFRVQRQFDESYENNYAHKYLSRMESSFLNPSINVESIYFNNEAESFNPNYSVCPSFAMERFGEKSAKSLDHGHASKANVDLVYVGKSSTNQLELSAVPKDKMTLLSQIEPSVPDKSSEEMTANLTAWFASMRGSDSRQMPFMSIGETKTRLPSRQEMSKNPVDLGSCIRQLQIDANRQFQTLQNMHSIQSAPWNAYNLIGNRVQAQQTPEEYDSSEDVRVYMKPGSYNVPKKRHQRRSNRRAESSMPRNAASNHRGHFSSKEKAFCAPASSTPVSRIAVTSSSVNDIASAAIKLPFLATPVVPPPSFSLENSPRILKRSDAANYTAIAQDVTWKAACASAEILLEALNVREDDTKNEKSKRVDTDPVARNETIKREDNDDDDVARFARSQKLRESFSKTLGRDDNDCAGASSYEASEDDSGSTSRFSPNTSVNEVSQSPENKNGSSKRNVKTDSWLIKTLNNASMVNKPKRRKNNSDAHSSESSNSSVIGDEQTAPVFSLGSNNATTTVTATTMVKNLQQMSCSRKSSCTLLNNDQTTPEETEHTVGRATYSETVRRCTPIGASPSERKEFGKKGRLSATDAPAACGAAVQIPGRKCQRKDSEKSYYLLHSRSRKCPGKRAAKSSDVDPRDPRDPRADEASSSRAKNSTRSASIVPFATSKAAAASKHGKRKEIAGCVEFLDGKFGGKASDRGWSVWYSSKRKQSLSPLALSKLEAIHQTVWQMEEAEIFKCPSSENGGGHSSTRTIEEYCKVVKSPMFLETVEYKLKNRVYHKVEHAVRDFRRIVYNSKLYHKDDHARVKMIETLSKKLEELFEEHFASWDFDNISGSPREDSPAPHRFKSTGQKMVTGRYGNAKKSPSSSIIENA